MILGKLSDLILIKCHMNGDKHMKRVLIIGASGYLGARLSESLADNHYSVKAVCFPSLPDDTKWLGKMESAVVGDITNANIIEELTAEIFDVCIYLVSLDHSYSNGNPNEVVAVNVLPAWNILRLATKNNTFKKFFYFSTIQVYGNHLVDTITEKSLATPANPYGLTHLMVEQVCNMYNSTTDMECINVRLSNSFGSPVFKDANCWWLVVNDFCKSGFKNNEIVIKSSGKATRDFIHYKDIINAILILIKMESKSKNNTFNISSGVTISILDLAELVKNVYKKKYNKIINIIPKLQPGDAATEIVNEYQISNDSLRKEGYTPHTTLEEGILELFEYLEKLHE